MDLVGIEIEESRPISKRKCWVVLGGAADTAQPRPEAAPVEAAETAGGAA